MLTAKQWLLLLCAAGFFLASFVTQEISNAKRTTLGLASEGELRGAPPHLTLAAKALAGFRGIIVDILWVRALDLQHDSKYFELVQLSDWI